MKPVLEQAVCCFEGSDIFYVRQKRALAATEPVITGWECDTQGKYRYRKADGQ